MEQIASQIIGPTVNILTGHITKHLGYVTSFTKHVNNMGNKMKVLEGKSEDVKKHMETNKKDNKEIPARVEGWLREVENVKNKVQSISCDGIGCLDMKKRYRVGRNAFKTIKDIERLIEEEKEFKWSDAKIPLGRVSSKLASTSAASGEVAQNDFKSRERTFKDALKYLQQDDKASQVIALCGMGGVGKTTMMERLKKVAEDNNMFRWIAKVVIGQNPNMLSVQKDISVYIGDHDLPEASKSVRADHLHRKFEQFSQDKEKTLVILDDVWEKIELRDIGLRSPLPTGVTLLLTSRYSNVCTQIAFDADADLQIVRVDVLKETEAQKLFCQITHVSQYDIDKYLIGCDIVKKCGCLPLAIKLIASRLKSKEVSIWKNALNRLKNSDLDKNLQEIIKISYEYIEEEEDKQIFLHCGLFPEDSNIPIEDLTRHGWGLKLFKNVSTLREARDRTNTCVENLKNSNLLMDGDLVGCVKMHDLVLAFVLGRVSKGDIAWIINHRDESKWDRDEMSKPCERISLTCRGPPEFPRDFKYPNLSLLQLMHGNPSLTLPEVFYENKENLKVIAFYEMQYPRLPTSLTNLRSLCLHECRLMFDCSFIGDLVSLEVLSFAHCGIRKLPSTIGKLRNLKLLDLTGCVDLHIDEGVFKNLENLEELYMRVSGWKAIRFTDANFEELNILSEKLSVLEVEFIDNKRQQKNISFKKLDKFKIAMGCLLKNDMYNDINSVENTLKLVTDRSSDLLACKIDELLKKTINLHLEVKDMIRLQDVSHHPYDQHSFFSLRDLEVSHCAELKYLFPIYVASGLKNLERLKVSSCLVLEALIQDDGRDINSEGEMIKFEELKFLSLHNLPKLVCLFIVDNVVEIPQLVELEVDELPNFTSIYPHSNTTSALQQPFLNSQVRISELKKLKVKSMEKLTHIWACSSEEEVNNISLLREIEVTGCDSVVNMFPKNPMRLLNNLEKLTIEKCGSIEVIFNIDLGCVGEAELVSNNSLKSIQVFNSANVREVWRIKGGESNSSSIRCFEAVEIINIKDCKRFRNVFTPTNIRFDMRAVMDISIYDSEESKRNKKMINVMSSEEEIPEVIENILNVAFPSYLIPTFPRPLSNLYLRGSERVKVVFEISCNGELTPSTHEYSQQQQILLLYPYLKDLTLWEMKSMTHVWKCDAWNKFVVLQKQHPQPSFHNLTTIRIYKCLKIKYLFSHHMAKLLSNLEEIDIRWCEGIEEVVSDINDDKDEEMRTTSYTYTHTTTNFFPHLHSLYFYDLRNLKRIGGGDGGVHNEFKCSQGGVLPWSLCQYSKEIKIGSCDALSSVIPSYALGQMQNLQDLVVSSCGSLIEVFETEGISNKNNIDHEGNIGGTNNTITPRLPENINNMPQLFNLKKLVIWSCNLLQHVLTFSTLESLKQLEELSIGDCNAMIVIVKKENDSEQRKDVELPRLRSLTLQNLSNLEGFFLGMNDFQWPLLEKVKIDSCPKMMVFTYGQSTAPKLKYIHTRLGKHSLECGLNFHVTTDDQTLLPSSKSTSIDFTTLERLPWSVHNLIEINMKFNQDVKCIISSNDLLQLQKLERIKVDFCLNLKKVFDESHTVVEILNLKQVELKDLYDLEYILERNHHGETMLRFPNLTTVSIVSCGSLKHVFTSSMVGSLQKLKDLHISDCKNMEVIILKEEEDEFECDVKVKEIECLKSLKLEKLQSLEGFFLGNDDFSLPSLHNLEIKECPQITVFTKGHAATPALNIIETSFGRCYLDEEDLNSFIKSKQHEGFQL